MNTLNKSPVIDIFRQNWLIPCILSLGLLLFVTRQSVQLIQFVQQKNAPAAVQINKPHKIPTLPNIAEWHLFGRFETDYSHLPPTHLPLTLQGTLLNTQSIHKAGALISDADGQTKLYRVGQSLPGDAKVQEIQSTQVILDNHGHLESLHLPIEQLPVSTTSQ